MNNIACVNGGILDMEGNGIIFIGSRAKVVFMYNINTKGQLVCTW